MSTFCRHKLVALNRSKMVCQMMVIKAVSYCSICLINRTAVSLVSGVCVVTVFMAMRAFSISG
ncbi:hypothetical protein DPMN_016782 [Dreissena polymorpha]|uniref:Uncharacterized protein n=1 Tax=Dreissena polymorpha TaxID=45954 RepID=A0A9D4NF89_DREPO|nr:hypothetical protein DPMN_016782 [Dreissena polymorpha]